MDKLITTLQGVVGAIGISLIVFVGFNKLLDVARNRWAFFTTLFGAIAGLGAAGLAWGNRMVDSPALVAVIATLIGAAAGYLVGTLPGMARIGVGVLGGAGLGVAIGWFLRTEPIVVDGTTLPPPLPALQVVPLILWPAAGAAIGGLVWLARRRRISLVSSVAIWATLGWVWATWAVPNLGSGPVREALTALAVAGGGFGLAAAAPPIPDSAGRELLTRRWRTYVFLGPALLFIGGALVLPTIRTLYLSFLDERGREFVGGINYAAIFTDPKTFNVSGWPDIFSRAPWLWGLALLLIGLIVAATVARQRAAVGSSTRALSAAGGIGIGALVVVVGAVVVRALGRGFAGWGMTEDTAAGPAFFVADWEDSKKLLWAVLAAAVTALVAVLLAHRLGHSSVPPDDASRRAGWISLVLVAAAVVVSLFGGFLAGTWIAVLAVVGIILLADAYLRRRRRQVPVSYGPVNIGGFLLVVAALVAWQARSGGATGFLLTVLAVLVLTGAADWVSYHTKGTGEGSVLSSGMVALGLFFIATAVVAGLRGTIFNNLWWVIMVTSTATALGLGVAVLADRAKYESVAKSIIFMPMAISFVGAGIIWQFMYVGRPPQQDQTGVMNGLWVAIGRVNGADVPGPGWLVPLLVGLLVAGLLAFYVYNSMVRVARHGASLGKEAMGIRLADVPATGTAVLRELAALVLFPVTWIPAVSGGTAIHDRLAGTAVVDRDGSAARPLRRLAGRLLDEIPVFVLAVAALTVADASNNWRRGVALFVLAVLITSLGVLIYRAMSANAEAIAAGAFVVTLPLVWLGYRILGPGIGGFVMAGETRIADIVLFIADTPYNNIWLMVVLIWIQTGFTMVIFSAAIKAVPQDLIEAAKVDGATESQTFWGVTVPQIMPTIGVVATTLIVLVMKVFDIVKVMTNGNFNTQVVANEMWQRAFTELNFGLGSALAVVLFLAVLPVMIINIRRIQKADS